MYIIWKRFTAWVTGLRSNPFLSVHIKLTLVFIAATITLLLLHYLLLYSELSHDFREFAAINISPERRDVFIQRSNKAILRAFTKIDPEDIIAFTLAIAIGYGLSNIALRPIKRAMEQQRTFIINASHELKTPLTILKTEMETFLRNKKYKLTENILLRRRQTVLANLEEINRMSRTINELLLLAHIDIHDAAAQFHPTTFTLLTQQSVQQMRSYATLKNIDISVKGDTKNVFIHADAERLLIAFTNVLKNAIDYSNKGERIIMHIQQDNRWAKISIIDHGIGITPKDLPHIFERFYRGHNSLATKATGSGLGLSIVRWIITQHKGTITVKSVVNKGTTVTIVLPLISHSRLSS